MSAVTPDRPSSGRVTEPPLAGVAPLGQVVLFYAITFAATWALFLPLMLGVVSPLESVEGITLLVLGVGAPTITAFVLTARVAGRAGVRRLWRQGTRWRVSAAWYAVVLAGPGLAYGVGLAVAAGVGRQVPPLNLSLAAVVVAVVVNGLLAGLLEEFGWCGVAFPGLQARYGLLWAGVVVGVTLAVWHIPFFFVPGLTQGSFSFWLVLASGIPLRILYGWVYNGTGGSVLLMILLHASANAWSEILPLGPMVPEPAYLTVTAISWGAAVAVLRMNRGAVPRPRPA